MHRPMFELVVYPACLDCRWREMVETEAYGGSCTRFVTECAKLPVCELIDGQEQIGTERGSRDGRDA